MTMKVSISFSSLFPILLWLSLAPTIGLAFNHGNFTRVLCSQTERDALLKLKHDLTDPSNRLASWVDDGDCCRWHGIVCHNVTGHVIELNLRSLSLEEYIDAFPDATADAYEDYERLFLLRGKINPSLLNLKHLMHLDLSNNDFVGIHIPKFLGSLGSLIYLNLSGAGFGGMIPHQLGNLSNLHYLNLRGNFDYYYDYESYVENLDWISGLSSLEFLDLSDVNLSKAFDWLEVINNALPSLVELRLSNCQLPPIPPLVNVNSSSLFILDLSSNYNYLTESLIPNHLQNLTSLRELDLSDNGFISSIPNWLYGFSRLELLNLGWNNLRGEVSSAIQNMTSLIRLDLSNNPKLEFNRGIPASFKNLCNLKELYLLGLKLNQDIAEVFEILLGCVSDKLESLDLRGCQLFGGLTSHVGQFKNLAYLSLAENQLNGTLPDCFRGLKKLIVLDISINLISGPMPMSFGELASLTTLILSYNRFNGTLPDCFGGLKKLNVLDISSNLISGPMPMSFGELASLTALFLSNNRLNGTLPNCFGGLKKLNVLDISSNLISGPMPMLFGELASLTTLILSNNRFNGTLPDCFGGLKKLNLLDISNNSISGPTPMSFGELASLTTLILSNNRFNGTLPASFKALTKLEEVHISDNLMVGDVFESHFANLTKLQQFFAGGNQLILRVSPIDWIPPLQLVAIDLRSWNIGPQFPTWLRSLKYLFSLDLSNSRISSTVPTWFWNFSSQLVFLNLSHNQIHTVIPNNLKLGNPTTQYPIVDLSSNSFKGPLPSISSNVYSLNLSNNLFSGSIISFLCHKMHKMMKNMRFLNLGENLLSGEIPDCWRSWQYLEAIKLSNNRFRGNMPKSLGTLSSLKSLHFRNNSLSGELPKSLKNCLKLVTLDVGENELTGNIPRWMGERLSSIVVLNMRANKFHGHIPKELCNLAALQILDLAHNYLSRSIPTCVYNFSAMATRDDSSGYINIRANASQILYHEDQYLVMKGVVAEYSTILGLVRSIDLSNNALYGEIPMEIIRLGELLSLNLSQNSLSGKIPKDIGVMRSLESIDFSLNQLFGEIPPSMSSLTFLSHLNLSHNKLWGEIPLGTQLQSFSPSSFIGNELCGLPLSKNCSEDGTTQDMKNGRNDHGSGMEINWFYVSMAVGFIVGFWSIVSPLLFNRRCRYVYFHFLDRLWDKIWWHFHVNLVSSLN